MASASSTSNNNKPTNPNPRNSEIVNPMRRSFSGNPFSAKLSPIVSNSNQRGSFHPNTPVHSPSDNTRRSFSGSENIIVSLRDFDDKENGKDYNLKPSRIKSPASSNSPKHFMSPTISAASKFNPSPRKKILNERNEPIRTSISFSGGKSPLAEDKSLKPEKGSNQKKAVSFDPSITYLGSSSSDEDVESKSNSCSADDLNLITGTSVEKDATATNDDVHSCIEDDSTVVHETFTVDINTTTRKVDANSSIEVCLNESLEKSATENEDCVNLDPSFKISPGAPSSIPSPALKPLDADPLMLPYDPKTNFLSPRPQFLHYKPNPRIELYKGDGKRLDESFTSEDFSDSEITEEETQSEDSSNPRKESEEEEAQPLVSEVLVGEAIAAETKSSRSSRWITRRKFFSLLLVFGIACLWFSVANLPIMEHSVFNNLSLPEPYVPPELSEFVRRNSILLAQKIKLWSSQSVSSLYNLINGFMEQHKLGPLTYANLTLLEDGAGDSYQVLLNGNSAAEEKYESVLGLTGGEDQPIQDKLGPLTYANLTLPEDGAGDSYQVLLYGNSAAEEKYESVLGPTGEEDQPIQDKLGPITYANLTLLEDGAGDSYQVLLYGNSSAEEKYESVLGLTGEEDQPIQGDGNDQGEEEDSTEEENDDYQRVEVGEEIVSSGNNFYLSAEADEGVEAASYVVVELQQNIGQAAMEAETKEISNSFQGEHYISSVDTIVEENLILASGDNSYHSEVDGVADAGLQGGNNTDQAAMEIQNTPSTDSVQDEYMTSSAATEFIEEENYPDTLGPIPYLESPQSSQEPVHFPNSQTVVVGVLIALSLLVVAAFVFARQQMPIKPNASKIVNEPPLGKKLENSPLSVTSNSEHTLQDIVGESWPSEMSSYENSLSYNSKKGQTSEAQSQERKPRKKYNKRESMTSSDYSMGSPSYGSFTTSYGSFTMYEKIPVKNEHGEEEEVMITPVRRSSRIRNIVTSP